MTDSRANTPSVVERTRPVKTGAPVVAAHFLRETAAFVLGEGALMLVPRAGEPRSVPVHDGAVLASAADAARIVTGGDDGKVVATDAEGQSTILAADAKQRWIDHVAVGPAGALAWSAGREACVRTAKGSKRTLEVPSTVGGLAFAPKGLRLAIAHYNGLTLWFANAQSEPERLQWKGSHLDGKWLATSGSTQLILWPFQGKDGPMGKAPRILAPAEVQVDVVACHPKQEAVAVGYADGLVLLVRIEDGAEVLARKASGAPITALAWNATGTALAVGAEDGAAGVIDLG